jgi:hypothetical protein
MSNTQASLMLIPEALGSFVDFDDSNLVLGISLSEV